MNTHHFSTLRGYAGLLLLSIASIGCRTQMIPNTDVDDTPKNREIVACCERYRKAVEHRDVRFLLSFAGSEYYEDGGNADASDDLDYAGLEAYLNDKFKQAKGIRYEMRYRRVSEGRKKLILVDYTYSASYKIPSEEGDIWRRRVSDNRLVIRRDKEKFKIIAGM